MIYTYTTNITRFVSHSLKLVPLVFDFEAKAQTVSSIIQFGHCKLTSSTVPLSCATSCFWSFVLTPLIAPETPELTRKQWNVQTRSSREGNASREWNAQTRSSDWHTHTRIEQFMNMRSATTDWPQHYSRKSTTTYNAHICAELNHTTCFETKIFDRCQTSTCHNSDCYTSLNSTHVMFMHVRACSWMFMCDHMYDRR